MFTADDLRALLNARPFVPFRLVLSDGGSVEIKHRELLMPGRRYAVIGLPDATQPDALFDRHTVIWYMHVTRAELLGTGPPPFAPPGESAAPSPFPA